MVQAVGGTDDVQIGVFFDFIFELEDGYVYTAHKVPGNQRRFQQTFFHWPDQRYELVQHILQHRSTHEVYYAPALFTAPSSLKEHVKGARVYWCDFDGKAPNTELLGKIPKPSLRISSSIEGHEHWYWKVNSLRDTKNLERVNRQFMYQLGADTSGWDANQILRPPLTFNHKRERSVVVTSIDFEYVDETYLHEIPEPPPAQDIPVPESIPDITDVISKYKFPQNVFNIFRTGAPVGRRSATEMKLGYHLAEMNLTNEEMLSLLLNADERWGKFSGRQDQLVRLMEIVTIARVKYPFRPSAEHVGKAFLQPEGFLDVIRSNISLEWVVEGLLQKGGYMLITGPSQVGKTMLSLDLSIALCLGQRFIDFPVDTVSRVGYFSLEMPRPDLKHFLLRQQTTLTEQEQEALNERLLFFPLGEPLYLDDPETRSQVEQIIGDLHLDGVVFDSLGSTTTGVLSDEKPVKQLMDWNDRLRQVTGAFTIYIHHHRKASKKNETPNSLSDVYGNQYLTARATTVLCMWPTETGNIVDFIPLKVRLSARPGNFRIKRGDDLRFAKITPGVLPNPQPPSPEHPTTLTTISIDKKDDEPPDEPIKFKL